MNSAQASGKKTAVVLFNLGGPTSPESIQPFLFNLFNDPAIIQLPNPFRYLIARLISSRRVKEAQEIYEHLGGSSPLLQNTHDQATALQARLGKGVRVFTAMRYWHPRVSDLVPELVAYEPDEIVMLPLYPQFSMTTSGSSFLEFEQAVAKSGIRAPLKKICCYPQNDGFVRAVSHEIVNTITKSDIDPRRPIRLLFSAHGLPKAVIKKGDPYQMQVEWSVKRTLSHLITPLEAYTWSHVICYQSRVGPMEWIGPATDDEIKRACADEAQIVIIPIAFVSEHSETLVELDIEYRELAEAHKAVAYLRVPTASVNGHFIDALTQLVESARQHSQLDGFMHPRYCPCERKQCLNDNQYVNKTA